MEDAENPQQRSGFRRALLVALRDGNSPAGYPVLRQVCDDLGAAAASGGERRLWSHASQLCAALTASAAERTPVRLLSFRDLDRFLAEVAPDEAVVEALATRLSELLPEVARNGISVPSAMPVGLSSAMESISSHPAWEDEDVQAARDALASLVGSPPEETPSATHPPAPGDPESIPASARNDKGTLDDEGQPTPLANVMPRLERVLRLGCQNLDRRCLLRMEGGPSIGRNLLKRLIEPLEIVLRNGLFFGVAPERPTTAVMTLRIRDNGGRRRIELETDGVSPDLARIAMEALREGTEPGSTSGLELLLDESRSTADHATRLRGYGAGLLEARQALAKFGAHLSMELPRDAGLRFSIDLADDQAAS